MSKIKDKIQRAYEYYPFGMPAPGVYGNWIVTPTVLVKALALPDAPDVAFAAGTGIYPAVSQSSITTILANAAVTKDVTIDERKHSKKCTARFVLPSSWDEKRDENHPNSASRVVEETEGLPAGSLPRWELAWPLYDLMRACKCDRYTAERALVYGWKDGEPVIVCSARVLSQACLDSFKEGVPTA
jgi:hypothetical protein